MKVLSRDKIHLLLDDDSDEAHEIKQTERERERESFELVSITNNEAFIPYDDFLYRIHLPKGGEFCFPTNNHGVTPIGKTPWADTSKSSSKNAYIDNIRISNTYHNNFTFPYERTIFYRGVDNMVSTLCDIHNLSKVELFTLIFLKANKNPFIMRERLLINHDKKKGVQIFDRFKFDSLKLRGGEDYAFQYILSGKILATRKIRFEDFTYNFRRKIL